MVIVANAYGCTQGPFWLSGRTILIPFQQLKFLSSFFTYTYAYVVDLRQLPKRKYSAQLWHYCRGRSLNIGENHDTAERKQF